MIKIRQSIAAPQFAAQCSSCENGTLLIITFNKPPSNFTLLNLAEHRSHVHILGAVLHTCTCNCCFHTSRLFSKSEQKGTHPNDFNLRDSVQHTHSNTHIYTHTPTHTNAPLSLRSAHQIKWILWHGPTCKRKPAGLPQDMRKPSLWPGHTSRSPSQKQTSTRPARHTYPISFGLTFTAY